MTAYNTLTVLYLLFTMSLKGGLKGTSKSVRYSVLLNENAEWVLNKNAGWADGDYSAAAQPLTKELLQSLTYEMGYQCKCQRFTNW